MYGFFTRRYEGGNDDCVQELIRELRLRSRARSGYCHLVRNENPEAIDDQDRPEKQKGERERTGI